MHMKGEPMAGKENREIKNSVFVDLFYEDESAEANEIALFNAIHDEPLPEGTKIRRFGRPGRHELIRRAASAYGDSESDDEKTGNLCG